MCRNYKSKRIDKKFEKIGFKKINENEYVVQYERHKENELYDHVQCLDILHKQSGDHIIQSYQKDLLDAQGFARMWGITLTESELALKKAMVKGWK